MYINDHRVRTNRQLYQGGRGIAGFGDVDWSTCASTRPDPDDPTHFVDCLDATGAVIDSKPTPTTAGGVTASPSGTLFGYDQNTVLAAAAAGIALFILFKK